MSCKAVVVGALIGGALPASAQSGRAASAVGEATCSTAGIADGAGDTWAKARVALRAALPLAGANAPMLDVIRYERLINVEHQRVERQTLIDSTLRADAVPGWVAGGERVDVPSPDVLLDSSFTRTHCVSLVVDDPSHPGEAGVAFVPTNADASGSGVAGTIWISPGSPVLREIVFHGRGADRAHADDAPGGSVHYDQMPNGRVLATRWALHDVGHREVGGEVASASWPDGSRWTADLPALHGRVVAAGSRVALPGVVVGIRGTRFQAQTDSDGQFALPRILPGTYALDAVDPGLADFGVSSAATAVIEVGRIREPSPITLAMHSRAAMVDSLCTESRNASLGVPLGNALLVGRVRLPSGEPAVGAVIHAIWTDRSSDDSVPVRLGGRADTTGAFQMCGMPMNTPVRITAMLDSLVSIDTTVIAHADGDVQRVVVRLSDLGDPRLPAYRRRYLLVSGVDSMPVAGVDVNDGIMGAFVGRTAANGRVSLGALGEGSALLKLRKPGYEQRSLFVMIGANDTTPVRVPYRTATQLAAVKVTATAIRSERATKSGFEDRLKVHVGRFLTPQDLAKHPDVPLDVLAAGLGVRSQSVQLTGSGVSATILYGGHGPMGCPVSIYIDGFPYYSSRMPGFPPPDASRMYGADYAAIEYYAEGDGLPARFSATDAGCGVLLLWTRDP